MLEIAFRNVRYALQSLGTKPAAKIAAILSLAVGISASTVMFSIAYGVLLRPLPYPEADRLVRVWESHPGAQTVTGEKWLSNLTYYAWNGRSRTIGPLAPYGRSVHTVGWDEPARVPGAQVAPAVFTVLRVSPALGRFISDHDAREGADPVVVISDGLWRERFAADASAIGRVLRIDDQPHTIIGVARPGFVFPDPDVRLWTPLIVQTPTGGVEARVSGTRAIARLQPGVTTAQAAAEGTAVARTQPRPPATETLWGKRAPVQVGVRNLADDMSATVRPGVLLLLVGVAGLMVITGVNVSNLLLALGVSRERELAVRVALGAARARVVGELLTESLVISTIGGVLGAAIAAATVRAFPAIAPRDFPRLESIRLDPLMLGFSCALSMVAGVAAGLVPALRSVRRDLFTSLRDGRGTAGGPRTVQTRRLFLLAETSLAVTLLCVALLVGRSFMRLLRVDPGYRSDDVVTARVYLPDWNSADGRSGDFVTQVLERVRAIPDIMQAGASSMAPFSSVTIARTLTIATSRGEPVSARALTYTVTPGFAESLGLHLRSGRLFTPVDRASSVQLLLVNETFVRTFLGGVPPVGFSATGLLTRDVRADIIGVIGDTRKDGLDRPTQPEVYVLAGPRANFGPEINLIVRARRPATSVGETLRAVIRETRSDAAIANVTPLALLVAQSVSTERLAVLTFVGLAGVGLCLAAIGLYGLMSYTVTTRMQEIGVRTALGATRQQIVWLTVREAAGTAAAGLGIGYLVTMALARVTGALVFGVDRPDLESFVLSAAIIAAIALVTCLLPTWRALHIDPTLAFKAQ
jgi:putative ABC transport system permease protein